jgi:hypothetical protein
MGRSSSSFRTVHTEHMRTLIPSSARLFNSGEMHGSRSCLLAATFAVCTCRDRPRLNEARRRVRTNMCVGSEGARTT